MLRVTLICSDKNHPVFKCLEMWKEVNSKKYTIDLFTSINEVSARGDILFLVSCTEIVKTRHRELFDHTLVLHASDLPKNRGWSPHIWAVINGESKIVLSLLEAEDKVDTGRIWKKIDIQLDGTELYDEINKKLFDAELLLLSWACENINSVKPQAQDEIASNYLRKRTPEDSELNINQSLKEQFNQLRVCDPERFPAYFYINGCKYKIKVEKY
ncbi:formyltransferase family protein [Pseudoalteromonas sp. NZS11]|uniref:formyltransferase family protein n=1 Tax=Pseudoalteromonas sp. NZS11 TaxID=2792049 RepID=UPI0018CD25A9|nr:formyltransferase family protein [Pseudoalteromonas sp. NZS11]MBH0078181.1 UDP-glucuronic acid dehydrogenase [Pseudoalteromonas sp. NZS11]